GAGWMSIEMTGTGREFPQAGRRVSMYIAAVKIARELIDTGSSKFKGRHYQMEIEGVGPRCDPPPELSAALGGPRMIREVTPLVDRVEVKGAGSATRGGALDFAALASIGKDDIRRLVDQVRSIDPEKPLSFFALAAAGRNPVVKGMESMLGDGVYGGLNGEPEKVATNLRALGEIGFERVNVSPTFPGTEAALAPFLFGGS
ncbi:MAG TPA: hypothetical protein QGF35_01295, partial [Dehalococcoidia bacterium]|nr:hypothetical protein [Dehalococcoidia bacterium]